MKALILIALLLSLLVAGQLPIPEPNWDHIDNPIDSSKPEEWAGLNVHPSVKLRLAQGVSDMIKQHLLAYGREFLNTGHYMKDHGQFELQMPPLLWFEFKYSNLKHSPISVDFSNFTFNYTQMVKDGQDVLFMELPLVKHWAFHMDYEYRLGFFPHYGSLTFDIEEAIALATFDFKSTDSGLLYPQLHDIDVNFGQSKVITRKGGVHQFFMNQVFNLVKYVTMDAVNRFGVRIFNRALPHEFARMTNDQKKLFNMTLQQFDKSGEFNVDWRLTGPPKIHSNVIDFDFFFDVGPLQNHCTMHQAPHEYDFEHFDSRYMQVIITDRVPNCVFDAMQRQGWFDFNINSQWVMDHLGTLRFPITTKFFSAAWPVLEQYYPEDQEFDLELKVVDPRIMFGPESGENVHLKYEVRYGIKESGSMNYVIYDAFKITTNFNFEISEEVLLANFITMDVTPASEPTDRT